GYCWRGATALIRALSAFGGKRLKRSERGELPLRTEEVRPNLIQSPVSFHDLLASSRDLFRRSPHVSLQEVGGSVRDSVFMRGLVPRDAGGSHDAVSRRLQR